MARGRKKGSGRQQLLAPTELQRCSMCKIFKEARFFGFAPSRATGYMSYCKECMKIRDKQRIELHKMARNLLDELVVATAIAPWNYDEIERILTIWKTKKL